MSSINKNKDEGEEESSQNTPQAITITIMDTSSMDGTTFRAAGLGTTTLRPTIVSSSETQDAKEGSQSLLVVSGNDGSTVSVSQSARDLLQTVTETHMGSEELPVISNISSSEDVCDQSTIQIVTKTGNIEIDRVDEAEESEGGAETSSYHCLICNEELQEEQIPVFKTLTTTSQRKVSVYIGILVGQKLTSRKVHSDIICPKCFSLLNRLDLLEIEIRDTKEELVNTYQETVAIHGGRARRRKPAAAKKSDYVFPKIEPDDEDQQAISLEMDETFEPKVDDILDEEHDRREDRDSQDEEWEPEYKRARAKREASETDPRGPPKRKRGRPRKDAAKSKEMGRPSLTEAAGEGLEVKPTKEDSSATNHMLISEDETSSGETMYLKSHSSSMNLLHKTTNDKKRNEPPGTEKNLLSFKLDLQLRKCSCGVRSKTKEQHIDHLMSHLQKHFKCPTCPAAFSSSAALQRHQRLLHFGANKSRELSTDHQKDSPKLSASPKREEKLLVCKYCKENVTGDMSGHAELHFYGREECPVCTAGFTSPQSLESHMRNVHPHFLQSFLKFEESQSQEKTESGDNITPLEKCDICCKVMTAPSRLAQHRYQEHPEHYPWTCSYCDLAFSSQQTHDSHWCPKKDSNQTSTKSQCRIRITKSKSKTSFKDQQISNDRSLSQSFTCPVCAVTLASKKALTDHVRWHKGVGFKCEFCGVRLKSMASLKVHVNTTHTQVILHHCKMCSQIFFSSGKLSYHMMRHHTDPSAYTNLCHLCGKSYPYPSELKLHLRSHRNERPFKCEQCPKTFMKKGDLTYHIRSHTGERPHKCPHCESRFPRPNTLLSHIRQQHPDTVRASTADAATTTPSISTNTCKTPQATVTISTSSAASNTVLVMSTNAEQPKSHTQLQQERQTTAAMLKEADVSVQTQDQGTVMPIMEGQLVDAVVDGQQVTEMQPVQYVQVGALAEGQSVQTVQTVPQMVEGMEYDDSACGSYQIVHLQILQ